DMTGQELQQARRYIIQGEGEAPVRWWWAKPPFPGHKTRLVADANSSSGSVFLPANNSSAVERAEN
ncbi:MAG TPA: hypothetical protein VHN11_05025, partial [Xanthobacteraceae bacterium]|nr:hypothetical protein [Xanthobacteraceae bacterium]